MRPAFVLPLLFLFFACADDPRPDEIRPKLPSPEEVRAELQPLSFDDFVDRSYKVLLARSPELVLDLGLADEIPVGKNFLDDISDVFNAETEAIEAVILETLRTHDRLALSRAQRTTLDVYEWWLDDRVRDHVFADQRYIVAPAYENLVFGTEFFFSEIHPLENEEDGEIYVDRLWRIEEKLAQLEQTLIRRERAGMSMPRDLMSRARARISDIPQFPPRNTFYFFTLQQKLGSLASEDLLERAEEAIAESVQPAYASLDQVLAMLEENAPLEIGVWQLPDGDNYYAHRIRHHTTLELTADEVHELGVSELARVRAELEVRFAELGYPSDATLREQIERVERDAGIVPAAEVVPEYEAIIAEAERRLDVAFDVLPSSKVIVIGDPFGGDFYYPPSLDGSRPGAFYANAPEAGRPRYDMKTLAYHEALPGHHLAIGIAQDLRLPLLRRLIGFTGFDEGWGLYAEALAAELGWYDGDPHGDIGRLQYEAYRATRLVVDTGMHAKRWSFDQALEFFEQNTGFNHEQSLAELIRYACWPGQALAYKTGMLEIQKLRREVETNLGPAFDLRTFHSALLTHGSVPLEVMVDEVREDLF